MSRKIRVLQFITPAGFYGAERWVLALANNIDRDVLVCDLAVTRESPTQDLRVAEEYPADAGQVHYLEMSGRFDLRVVSRLVEVIRERQIDIILSHGYKSDILGLLAARRAGIRCVSTPHGFPTRAGFKMGLFIRAGSLALRHFDAVAPLSEELVADMKRIGVADNKICFIRNGVDLKEIDETLAVLPQPAAAAPECRYIGYIGQLIARKGIPALLRVFDRLHGENPGLVLRLVGGGSQQPELEAQARHSRSGQAVEFLGFRDDRLALLREFSLFVMTSSLEGIPRCLMEAMAVGVPVVAYDIPGVDQLVEHEVTGLLAPFGDEDALLACCQRLLSDRELAGRLVSNAREKVETVYSARRMASEYEALFSRLVTDLPATAEGKG